MLNRVLGPPSLGLQHHQDARSSVPCGLHAGAPRAVARPVRDHRCHTASPSKSAVLPGSAPSAPATPAKRINPFLLQASIDEDETADILELTTLREFLTPRESPLCADNNSGGGFVGDRDRIRLKTISYENDDSAGARCENGEMVTGGEDACLLLPDWVLRSGPRKTVYYDPKTVLAAVLTCGGLCPGLNDVVQNIVYTLNDYGVPEENVLGIRYGLRGFYERDYKPINLTPDMVDGIHLKGGTQLGTSRGGANIKEIVKRIRLWGLNMVFVIGGNGGNAAAHAIAMECQRENVVCSIIGVPKSIDNDILLIDRCFGFETAVEEAQRALLAAKVEATSAHNGLGLVKLMGRHSGFIAMNAAMASGVADICLIPEVPFKLDKLCQYVQQVFDRKGHCVICVAEGAGQENFETHEEDASGNPVFKDVGVWLRNELKAFFKNEADIKYIDPTYMIRAITTTSNDRIYCKVLGQGAVHGAFAGYTDFTIGLVNTHYVYLPIETIIQAPRKVNPKGMRWNRLITMIRQPHMD